MGPSRASLKGADALMNTYRNPEAMFVPSERVLDVQVWGEFLQEPSSLQHAGGGSESEEGATRASEKRSEIGGDAWR